MVGDAVPATVSSLFERLNGSGIRYCHWKSNWTLEETIAGKTDLDLLVRRDEAPPFRTILQSLGFRPAIEPGAPPFPSVEHYHALDEESGALVHVHAYYRVISGDSLAKNYHLPIEEMLLHETRRVGIAEIPSAGAELVAFVLRMSLKHATSAELVFLRRDWSALQREAAWLGTDDARIQAEALLQVWLPGFDRQLFTSALEALCAPAPLWRRILLGRRVRAELRPFARRGRVRAWFVGERKLLDKGLHRLRDSRKGLAPATGGVVIAFAGAEAAGKSTLIQHVERWLGAHYTVRHIHAGKPPSTPLTAIPNLLLPALRALLPGQRSTTVSARLAPDSGKPRRDSFPLLFGIRSVLLAHDRRATLVRAFARSANGDIVLCDRYPSTNEGAIDGPQLVYADTGAHGTVRRRLAQLEARLYRDIPPPDLVILLTAPLDVTLERNRTRATSEPDEYVLSRHARSTSLVFDRARVAKVDTDRPLEDVLCDVRRIIWDAL